MRIIPALAVLLCTGSLMGQMPIPSFSRTFSASTLTRGFFFQAPIGFTITGLRVPDETQHGTQHVEVFIMPAAPPPYSQTGTGVSVFVATNQPSTQIISTSIPVLAGDWVGVLGACGDTSIMHNSYSASGPHTSSISGMPVSIDRFLTQTNLAASGGNQPYSSEPGGSIGRVEVYYATCNGSIRIGGMGCADSGGTVNTLRYSGCPDLGTSLTLEMNTSASATGPLFLVFGISDLNWGGIVLPLDLSGFGAPGCSNYVSHEFVLGGNMPIGGQATIPLQIPSTPFIVGATSHVQFYNLDIGLNPLNVATSDYLTLTIG